MMRADFYGYLHDDNLCKVDRAAMSVSLETRVPFLDKNVINFASSLPFKYKIKNNETKWILKEALFKNVPKELFDRPKAGFAIPIHEWMRSDLKDWASHLIFDLDFEDSEIINYEEIQKIWKQFLNGDNSYTYHIWDIIMLKAWMEKQKTI
jgi:asparagine synthase (glutamine-hydrolysing)